MASSNDGVYIKNGYVYKDGIGRIHKASEEEKTRYGSSSSNSSSNTSSKTITSSNSSSSSGSSSSSNRYNTTVTRKDGTTTSGYIENDRGYYSDGTALSAGDSIIDAQNKVWTKGGGSSSSNPGADNLASYLAQLGISVPNNPSGGSSSSSSYKVTSADAPNRTGYLRSSKELADLFDINYDMDAIRSIYDNATDAKYALLSKELEQGENDFYTNNAQANATLLDTLKKATSSAIATGASRGIAGAEQLGLMMEQQQAITEGATNLAQERANMADKIAAEKAENIIKALEYSNQLKQGLATNSTNVYSADTQYDVGLLDFYAQMKNVEALFEQINAEKDVNLKAQYLDALKAIMDDATTRSEGDKNRASNEKQNAENAAAQRAYYAAMLRNGGNSGNYGYGNTNIAGDDWDKIWNKGDRNQAVKYLREHWGMTWQEANERLDSDPQFLINEKYRGYSNIPRTTSEVPTNLKDMLNVIMGSSITPKDLVDVTKMNGIPSELWELRELYKSGPNSKYFKEMYNSVSSETRRIFDENYR